MNKCVKNPVQNMGGVAWDLGESQSHPLSTKSKNFVGRKYNELLTVALRLVVLVFRPCLRFQRQPRLWYSASRTVN